jgi:hypothetical protein
MSNLQLFTWDVLETNLTVCLNQYLVLLVIQIPVLSSSLAIVIAFFKQGYSQHEHKWRYVSEHKTNFEERHKLRQRDYKEEHVKEELEFIVQHFRSK